MTADYAALEARVAELERQMRHILPTKIDAVSYGLSLLHDDVRTFREETHARFDQIDGTLAEHGRTLSEILRHLTSGPNGGTRG